MELSGINIAAITPFEKEEVNYNAFKHNLQQWCKTDISGILVLGSTGECVHLNSEEKTRIIQIAREEVPTEKHFGVGIGCESVSESVKIGKRAYELGADYVLAVNPHYYKPMLNHEALYRYFVSIADQVPIPVLMYNIPQNTGIPLSTNLISEVFQHKNIIGIKDSSGNFQKMVELMQIKEDAKIICGNLTILVSALLMGAHGAILAFGNAAPQEICDVVKLIDQDKARDAFKKMLPIINLENDVVGKFGIPGLKKLMNLMGYEPGEPRLPMASVNQQQEAEIKEAYERFKAKI